MSDTTFSATMRCVSGGTMGTMSGTKNGDVYQGTFSFHNSGTIMVVPVTDNISVQGRVLENNPGNPIQGATVTTTIGGSVTTDANGYFFIQTDEPVKNGVGAPFSYCIDVRKPATHADAQDAGCMAWGDHPTGLTFHMDPSG